MNDKLASLFGGWRPWKILDAPLSTSEETPHYKEGACFFCSDNWRHHNNKLIHQNDELSVSDLIDRLRKIERLKKLSWI